MFLLRLSLGEYILKAYHKLGYNQQSTGQQMHTFGRGKMFNKSKQRKQQTTNYKDRVSHGQIFRQFDTLLYGRK